MPNIFYCRSQIIYFCCGCLLFCLPLSATSVFAAQLDVGSNQAYSSIASAISASSSGDTIVVHAGTYFESRLVPKSGLSATSHTVIMGAVGETRPVIDAQGQFNVVKPGFDLDAVSHVTLRNLDVINGGTRGVDVGAERFANDIIIDGLRITNTNHNSPSGSYDGCCNPAAIFVGYHGAVDGVVIENTYFNNRFASGVKIDSRNTHAQNVIVRNNYFDQDHTGVHVKWAQDNTDRGIQITSNYFYDNAAYSIHNEQAYAVIFNNIIHNSLSYTGLGQVYIGENKTAFGAQFLHNTLVRSDIVFRFATNVVLRDNILFNSSLRDFSSGGGNSTSGNFSGDPEFADVEAADYALLNTSAARNSASDGTDYGASPTTVGINAQGVALPPGLPAPNNGGGGGGGGGSGSTNMCSIPNVQSKIILK